MGHTFDRRTILKSIVVIGAGSVFEGCGDSSEPGETPGERRGLRAAFPVLGGLGRSAAEHGDALDPGHRAGHQQQPGAASGSGDRFHLQHPGGEEGRTDGHRGPRWVHQDPPQGPGPGDDLLLPVQLPHRHHPLPFPAGPDAHRAAPDHRRRGALRGGQLPGLRGPLLEHLPAAAHQGARRSRLRGGHRGLHLRDHRLPRLPDSGRPAIGDLHQSRRGHRPGPGQLRRQERGQLPRHLPHLPERPAAAASARAVAGDRHLGRPRVLRRLPRVGGHLHRRADQRAGRPAATERGAGVLRVPPGGRGCAGQRPHHRRGGHRPERALPEPEAVAQLRVREAPGADHDRPPELPPRPSRSRGRLPGDGDRDAGDAGRGAGTAVLRRQLSHQPHRVHQRRRPGLRHPEGGPGADRDRRRGARGPGPGRRHRLRPAGGDRETWASSW